MERSGLVSLAVLVGASLCWLWVLWVPALATWVRTTEASFMVWTADHRADWLTSLVRPTFDVVYTWGIPMVGLVGLLVVLVVTKRLRTAFAFGLSLIVVVNIVSIVQQIARRPRPYGIELLARWEWYAHPYRLAGLLAAACTAVILTLLPSGRIRRSGIAAAAVLVGFVSFSAVYLGVAHPTDVLMGVVVG
ncbi:MAG: phosphatase PAP2 family protein, partial [Candidatus Nanopelagicales bacterium]